MVGAAVFLLGMAFGRVIRLRSRRSYKPKTVKPECGCGHHFSLHDPETKACYGSFDTYDEPINRAASSNIRPCGCRQYSGPTPLPEFFAPEIGA